MARRLLVTFLLPVLVYVAGYAIPLPGLTGLGQATTGPVGNPLGLGMFSLGVVPVISGYILVELLSLAIPPLRKLRHGNPDGRRKLEIAAGIVAIVLAVVQAFGIVVQLDAMSRYDLPFVETVGVASKVVLIASLVGGTCVLVVAARAVSRQRIVNGILLFSVSGIVAELPRYREPLAKGLRFGTLRPEHALVLVLALGAVVAATILVLRRPAVGAVRATSTAYRDADPRTLAAEPWVPIPSSSFAAYTLATSLLMMPASLQALTTRGDEVPLFSDWSVLSYSALHAAMVFALVPILTRVLHRPQEMSELTARLGLGSKDAAEGARRARARALAPTFVYFAVLLVAGAALSRIPELRFGALEIPLLVAVIVDIVRATRDTTEPDLVSVWQERRVSAVPVLRAALAAEGIASKVTGMGVLALVQTFAPYAPAEILVRGTDASRANALLRHLLLGEDAPAREPVATPAPEEPKAPALKVPRLWPILVPAVIAAALAFAPRRAPLVDGPVRRAELEVIAVDDDVELDIDENALPAGAKLLVEAVPVGMEDGRRLTYQRSFVRVEAETGEPQEAAIARADRWFGEHVVLPPGRRLVWEVDEGFADDGQPPIPSARTLVVHGETILTTNDVVEADPAVDQASGVPSVYVAITLAPAAATRFAEATEANVNRRIAILIDGRVSSAPVVRSRIPGGRISVTMGQGDPDKQLAQAKALAAGLQPSVAR